MAMYENPKFTSQVIADINQTFDLQIKQWIATLDDVEQTFGVSKQRQRQLINANRVPGVARLNERNFIYQRDVAFEFFKGYAEFNAFNVDTDQETYIDPYNGAIIIIPENIDRETYFGSVYEEYYQKYIAPFENAEPAEYDKRLLQFQEWAQKMQTAILGN